MIGLRGRISRGGPGCIARLTNPFRRTHSCHPPSPAGPDHRLYPDHAPACALSFRAFRFSFSTSCSAFRRSFSAYRSALSRCRSPLISLAPSPFISPSEGAGVGAGVGAGAGAAGGAAGGVGVGGAGAGSCAHVAMAKTSAATLVESGVITRSVLEPSSDGWVGNPLVDDALSSMMLPRETTVLSRVSNVTPWLKPLHSRIFSMWDRRAPWNLFQINDLSAAGSGRL